MCKALARLISLLSLLLVASSAMGIAAPRAADGLIDLSTWDFTDGGIVSLDGEWEFYPNELVAPIRFAEAPTPVPHQLAPVPGRWNELLQRDGTPMGGHGFATYRLRLRLPDVDSPLAIALPYANTSYRLWIDSILLASNGQVGETRQSSTPEFRPRVIQFEPQSQVVDLVIHVANFSFRNGGLPRKLEIGLAEDITIKQSRLMMVGAGLFGAAFVMAIFFGALFLFHRENKSNGYFSVFLIVMAARLLVTGDHLLVRTLPNVPWELSLKIEYFTGYIAPLLLLLYLRSSFPDEVSPRVVKLWSGIAGAGILLALFTPGRISSQAIPGYMILFTLLAGYFILIGIRGLARRRPEDSLAAFGIYGVVLLSVVTLSRYSGFTQMADLIPLGTLLLLIAQGLILGVRWVRSFHQTAILAAENAHMLRETERQLKQLKEYRRLMTEREENLRRRISETLHGTTQGKLFAVVRLIERAQSLLKGDRDQANILLSDAVAMVHHVRQEDIRSIGRQLHPTAVSAGLVAAVESLLDTFEDSYKIEYNVDPKLDELDQAPGGIPYDIRLGLYRIVGEGLNNIAKHAHGAQRIIVEMSYRQQDERDLLQLTLCDDGIGIEPGRFSDGLGLPTIDARVGDLQGTWSLNGAPGKGTRLEVAIPLSPVSQDVGPKKD